MEDIKILIDLFKMTIQGYQELLVDSETFLKSLNDVNHADDNRIQSEERVNAERIASYTEKRNQLFAKLQEREQDLAELQAKICLGLGINTFSIGNLRSFLPPFLLSELEQTMNEVINLMQELLAKDQELQSVLQHELQANKLDLQRLRGAQKARQAYGSVWNREAYFIDKNK